MRVFEVLLRDFIYAFRVLRKNPTFTIVAVLTLALGIGANTAMFSVVNAVLLRSLPYPHADRLVRLVQPVTQEVTLPEYQFWKEQSTAYSSLAGYGNAGQRYFAAGNRRQWIKALPVTDDFLRTLGVNPAIGREFNSADTHRSAAQAIIVSNSLWQQLFGADPEIAGRAVRLDDANYTIVGVLPRDFWFPQAVDALIAIRITGGVEDSGTNTAIIGRLKDGVPLPRAQVEMANLAASFQREHADLAGRNYRAAAVLSYQDSLVANVRLNLLLLFGTTGLLFLIACSNLVSLLLARLASREKEIALRLALGSSSRAIVRQFLIENILISAIGTIAGLFVSYIVLATLLALLPFYLPVAIAIHIDGGVLAFAVATFLATALLFTLVPAFIAGRLNLQEALKAVGQITGTGGARQRIRNVLVVGQVAFSAMLLIGAGLLVQTLYRLHQEQLGFVPGRLITFETPLASDRYPNAVATWAFASTLRDRLQALPGVTGASAINLLPLTGKVNLPAQREGHPDQSIGGMEIRLVTPGYFQIMGIPVRQGRSFSDADASNSAPVVMVNETLARRWWPQNGSVGDRITIGRFKGKDFPEIEDTTREVVGVVGDTKTSALKEPPRPTVFIPLAQAPNGYVTMTAKLAWIVNSNASAGAPEAIRGLIAEFDPLQRVQELRTMSNIVESTVASPRFDAWLFGTFALLALALAAVGLYGLLSSSVAQRRQEIGTRIALGASRANVLTLIFKQGFLLVGTGLALGLVGAFFLTRFLSSLLYAVRPNDPLNYLAVILLLLLVGFVAIYIPSRRAARIDPITILRYE